MPRSRYKIYNPQQPYFLTCTVINWIPIFTRPATVNILLDTFQHLQKNHQLKLYGFVILENHLHWVAQSDNLPKDIQRFKSYTAKMILCYLKEQNQHKLLKLLFQLLNYLLSKIQNRYGILCRKA